MKLSIFATWNRAPVALWAAVFAMLWLSGGGCGGDRAPDRAAAAEEAEHIELASSRPGVPFGAGGAGGAGANRVGVPTTGADRAVAAEGTGGDDDADGEDGAKDYWKAITFNRSNFDEVRSFVRDRYIEGSVDERRAYAEAASFALASDEKQAYLLLPESFYLARKDDPAEKGRLKGKVTKLDPEDKFVVVEEVDADDPDSKKRLTDEEIATLREAQRKRTHALDAAWKSADFTPRDFDRIMDHASSTLGKDPTWSMKRAWVAAAQGYLYALDPHSALIPKQAWEDSTRETTDASFEGIGAILTRRPDSDYTIVESPIEGQPALKAGLRAGDMIVKVDGKSIKGELLAKVVKRIRGKKGTTVVLTVQREGVPDPLDIPIARSYIDIKNVTARLVETHDKVGYVKLTGFVPTTDRELGRELERLEAAAGGSLKGLILDLRGNSGGLLKQGIRVADRFLDGGVIVTVKQRGKDDEVHTAGAGGERMPLVVLVNDGAASASEIVASALQENDRALVVGDRTFGKASVQTLYSPLLRDEYYIKLTVARYYSPVGRTLQVVGVKPDLEVPPELGGKMPLGFREENLSHHLAPLDAVYPKLNEAYTKAVLACADKRAKAKTLHAKDPNPAVRFDYQKMMAADLLECMADMGRPMQAKR